LAVFTETDTVIKRILPYLNRRGYDTVEDIDFETATKHPERYSKGYVDLLVTCGKPKPLFLIEAKRSSKALSKTDAKQAWDYGKAHKVPFVVVTNGKDIQVFNTETHAPIKWDGKLSEKIPTKEQLKVVIRTLKANPTATDIPLTDDENSLPYRPGLPLKQLNSLFARCHNTIRKIEKNEESAFDDFSKLLFLKLLEEKADTTDFEIPYSYRFHELAARPDNEADQIRDAVETMIATIKKKTPFGDVLIEKMYLKNAKTFKYIVGELASVSFYDSSLDSKGAAFEYFVRATLKGKKLGQYFTPRPVVRLMSILIGEEKIYSSVASGEHIKVLDPACGTGGFLVFLMQDALARAEKAKHAKTLTKGAYTSISDRLMKYTFFGSDANDGVACAAKMNMIVAGDGHTNIQPENSLSTSSQNWNVSNPDCDIIITNPPFGTSETDAMSPKDWDQYKIKMGKGQQLFLQKMLLCTKPGGDVCTVIDDGLLNTASAKDLREWLFQTGKVKIVVRLPEDTFKPNKINVRSSIVLMEKWDTKDPDLDNDYWVTFIDVHSLGYHGSGEPIRGFDLPQLLADIQNHAVKSTSGKVRTGKYWSAFDVALDDIKADGSYRLDLKYWLPSVREKVAQLEKKKAKTIKDVNTIVTRRGRSPKSDDYVDDKDGYAAVIKAGTCITKFGQVVEGEDYVEKDVFDEMTELQLKKGDVLIASTGTGTLGKAGVFNLERPAIADGHVTIIRVDPKVVDPFFLADYLRVGAGAKQIERLYTGSTGLIELTPEDVDRIYLDLPLNAAKQKQLSKDLRLAETTFLSGIENADEALAKARKSFSGG
jgi:type I restriction enzyme M protein